MILEVTDFGSVERVANRLVEGAGAAHPRVMKQGFTKIGVRMTLAERHLFKAQGRRGGGSWQKLKEDTIKKKGNSRILYTRGSHYNYSTIGDDALYESLTFIGAPYNVFNVIGYELEFGTTRPNAWTHQVGYPARGIPARPFLKFTLQDLEEWKLILLQAIMRPWLVRPTAKDLTL